MIVRHSDEVPEQLVAEQAKGTTLRLLLGPEQGARNFHLRLFEIAPEGNTPLHAHPWEHEVYVLAGEGRIRTKEGETELGPGNVLWVEPEEEHQFLNVGGAPFRFLCVIPAPSCCG